MTFAEQRRHGPHRLADLVEELLYLGPEVVLAGYIALAGTSAEPVSGASMNLARSFWRALIGGRLHQLLGCTSRSRRGGLILREAATGVLDEGTRATPRPNYPKDIEHTNVVPSGMAGGRQLLNFPVRRRRSVAGRAGG